MASERIIPDNPLVFIRRCVRERKIFWTYHVQMRLKGRTLSREALLQAVDTYEIIESYPDDKYLPSYLIYGDSQEGACHLHPPSQEATARRPWRNAQRVSSEALAKEDMLRRGVAEDSKGATAGRPWGSTLLRMLPETMCES